MLEPSLWILSHTLVHSYRPLYRSKSPSPALYPCSSPLHPSAPVTSHCTPYDSVHLPRTRPASTASPSTSDPNTLSVNLFPLKRSTRPTTSKPYDPLYHSSFLPHQPCASDSSIYSSMATPLILRKQFISKASSLRLSSINKPQNSAQYLTVGNTPLF